MSARRGGGRGAAYGWIGAITLGTAIAYGFVNNQSKANVKRFEESSPALPHEKDWVGNRMSFLMCHDYE